MEDLAPPSLPASGPEGLARTSPAPQQQSQPRLCPRGWQPGFQGGLLHKARVAGAGPLGWGHPGTERGQQPTQLRLPMAPWCGPRCQGAALCPPPAQHCTPRSEPRLLSRPLLLPVPHPQPATLGSPAPPSAGQRPPPPQPAPGSCCSRSHSPRPSPPLAARPVAAD